MAMTFHPDGRIDGLNRSSMPTGSMINFVKYAKELGTQSTDSTTFIDITDLFAQLHQQLVIVKFILQVQ